MSIIKSDLLLFHPVGDVCKEETRFPAFSSQHHQCRPPPCSWGIAVIVKEGRFSQRLTVYQEEEEEEEEEGGATRPISDVKQVKQHRRRAAGADAHFLSLPNFYHGFFFGQLQLSSQPENRSVCVLLSPLAR